MKAVACALTAVLASAEKAEDLVTGLPGFPPASTWGFKAYSGFLDVPGPINGYDALKIHYQFHTSHASASDSPVVAWHQGGPGGSSITVGLYGEMGAFRIGDKEHGKYINPFAWNKVAHMLYLESPAGSGSKAGYSECLKDGQPVKCSWSDVSQAEAYAHTLAAFFKAFPEFASNDFYLSGESYFGQYGPNIAHFILNNAPFKSTLNLKGILAGNACWGGTENCVACNGPSVDRIDVDLYFGKGLFSPKLKSQIDKECKFPTDYSPKSGDTPFACDGANQVSEKCRALLSDMAKEVGPHNVYNIYDNCPATQDFLDRTGKSSQWLVSFLRENTHNTSAAHEHLLALNGGYDWDCLANADDWITRSDVRAALHLTSEPGRSGFDYSCSGPASVTIWPELAKKIRVLIYNGDADACVPYIGNEDWIALLESKGDLTEVSPWTPWYVPGKKASPAGYLTKYQAPGSSVDFQFATIRLAGHMAPQFQPESSFAMFSSFLGKKPESAEKSTLVV
eukprot:TRINITY_DN74430_c0_g1_i1.p1 TRINITY_DN74430_c0_g1~~TRINITY_DN74430_c0_g1_i1.p1  ORF type:complete len:509 (+),score=90.95 TRINITY_DN74430_c0_g1_i1:70-1596(+)